MLTAADLNAEVNNILNNPFPLINTMPSAQGDLFVSTGVNTWGRLAIGTSGQILTVSTAGIAMWSTGSAVESGSFTLTSTSFTVTQTSTAAWARAGNLVSVTMGAMSATSNVGAFLLTGLPAALAPARATDFLAMTRDNSGAYVAGQIIISTNGNINLFRDPDGDAFTAAGTKAFLVMPITYPLN